MQAYKISTHAPAGGATAPPASAAPPRFHFYSRPCGRGDYIVHHKRALTPISTHAPAGGATSRSRCCHRSPRYFYSRPCGRGDVIRRLILITTSVFLLTPLREGRRSPCMATSTSSSHFYSRPCGRGDQRGCLFFGMKRMNISTHAPAGGAT